MAQLVTLQFPHLNTSLQYGDWIYYVPTSAVGTPSSVMTFDTGQYSNIIRFGYVLSLDRDLNTVDVVWDDSDNDGDGNPDIPLLTQDDFILFSKNAPNNTSSLLGYFASVNFVNNSNEKIELFSVGSEVAESSK